MTRFSLQVCKMLCCHRERRAKPVDRLCCSIPHWLLGVCDCGEGDVAVVGTKANMRSALRWRQNFDAEWLLCWFEEDTRGGAMVEDWNGHWSDYERVGQRTRKFEAAKHTVPG